MLLYVKCTSDGSVANALLGTVHDLGSNPRSYKFPYYFSKAIPMCFKAADASCSFIIYPYTRLAYSDPRLGIDEHHEDESTVPHACTKVNKAMIQMGLNC